MNIEQIIKKIGFNPEKILNTMIGNNSNPIVSNLMDMMKKGDQKGIENFGRNIMKSQGKDFDKEFSVFMQDINKLR